jgi:DNA-binding response OmpR family regulator
MSEPITQDSVLVVEPDLIVRQPLAEYLRECGYKVFEAVDADEATTILTDDAIVVDVVLCDVNSLGSVDGFGLARWVRAKGLPCKMILAGSAESAAQKAGDLCEDGPLLSKPYDHGVLLDRIRRLLARRDRGRVPEDPGA